MLSSCMDSINTEPPETTFHVMVCCLPLGSLASHCPARAFRFSNDALAFGAGAMGTERAKSAIAIVSAFSFISFPPAPGRECSYLIYSPFFGGPLSCMVHDCEKRRPQICADGRRSSWRGSSRFVLTRLQTS